MKKGWAYVFLIMSILLLYPGCTCTKYRISGYFGIREHAPYLSPFPIIVENDSIKGKLTLERGHHELKKNHELRLKLMLRSDYVTQELIKFTVTGEDLRDKYSLHIAEPLKVKLHEGVGEIWLEGQKVNTKNEGTLELIGHSINIVYMDMTTATQHIRGSVRDN